MIYILLYRTLVVCLVNGSRPLFIVLGSLISELIAVALAHLLIFVLPLYHYCVGVIKRKFACQVGFGGRQNLKPW